MNKISRFNFIVVSAILLLAASGLQAQTSVQRLTFSLLANFQTNAFSTNTTSGATNEFSKIRDILIGTLDIAKAIAIDIDGTNSKTWNGSDLVREVNLTNGNEGIFLRKAGNQMNVSSYFSGSYVSNFTGGLAAGFPGSTNFDTNVTVDELELHRGWLYNAGATNASTNFDRSSGLHFIAVKTANLRMNLVGVGTGRYSVVAGGISGTRYRAVIDTEVMGTAGSFYLQVNTNIFSIGTNPSPMFVTGPLHGTVALGEPVFLPITGP